MKRMVVCSVCLYRQEPPASGLCTRCNASDFLPDAPAPAAALDLPPEPASPFLPPEPLTLPPDTGLQLPPARERSAGAAGEPTDEVPQTMVVVVRPPRPPSFAAGLLFIAAGTICFLAWLRDPPDGLGQWATAIGALAAVLTGMAVSAEILAHRAVLSVIPALAALLGVARGDPLMAAISLAFAVGAWLACDEHDDDQPARGLALIGVALSALLVVLAPIWTERAPGVETVATLRRLTGPLVASELDVGPHLSMTADDWGLRTASDTRAELTRPSIGGRMIARVHTLSADAPQSLDELVAFARTDFAARGWVDYAQYSAEELSTGADETVMASFAVRRGFTRDLGVLWASRMKDHVCTIAMVVPERRYNDVAKSLVAVAKAARCREGTPSVVELATPVLERLNRGLMTVRVGDAIGVAVIIDRRDGHLLMAGDDAVLGEGHALWTNVRPAIEPTGALRRARILRRAQGTMLLMMNDDPSLVPLDFAPPPTADTPIAVVGFDAAATLGRASIRSGHFSMQTTTATFEAGFRLAAAMVVTPAGELIGVLRGGPGTTRGVLLRSDVRPLTTPGARELAWVVEARETGNCALTARVDIDDPFNELSVVSLVFGERQHESVATVQKTPGPGTTTLRATVTCPTNAEGWSIGVESLSLGSMSKLLDTVEPVTSLPTVRQGHRRDPTRPGHIDAEVLSWIFDRRLPEPLGCGEEAQPTCTALCDRRNADACMASGRALLEGGRAVLAVNDFERGCVGHHLEACIQVGFLTRKHKTVIDLGPKVQPWCDAGVARACWALKPTEWEDAVRAERKRCSTDTASCTREALLLLDGPRVKADLTRAGALLTERCGESEGDACLALGLERRRNGALADAIKYFDRACFRKQTNACVEAAGAYASGSGTPRNMEQALTLLRNA
ncbi:MAG: sel1 repeat family protein, partial [Archangium sp.]|nr:sel1 repeat family protein [Archangium sp.]